jgi:peptidoglycan/xylan/chitin deacetylase (PgdA/CDA1 family)
LLEREDGGGVALTWQLVAEMERSGLCRFYSHTRSHHPCDALSDRELADELNWSRQIIETRLGRPCDYLCWPYGRFSPAAEAAARAAGYRALFTTEERAVHVGTDPYRMPRIEAVAGVSWLKKLLFP